MPTDPKTPYRWCACLRVGNQNFETYTQLRRVVVLLAGIVEPNKARELVIHLIASLSVKGGKALFL